MFGLEKELFEQVIYLKQNFQLAGIKAEFEAEGSSFNDLVRLRRITDKAGVGLYLKIGGVEALRDIKDSLELGVDGIIAPMVESKFGLKKFKEAYKSVYKDHKIKLSINVETRNSIDQIDDILDLAKGFIDNITLGRTDLAASYMDKDVTPDCEMLTKLVQYIGKKSHDAGLHFTVGGSISAKTVANYRKDPSLIEHIECIETRKVILPRDIMLQDENGVNEALRFEELYVLSKKEISDIMIAAELERLNKLSGRTALVIPNVA